jgi:hypothetical protein
MLKTEYSSGNSVLFLYVNVQKIKFYINGRFDSVPCEKVSAKDTHPHIIFQDSKKFEKRGGRLWFPHQD